MTKPNSGLHWLQFGERLPHRSGHLVIPPPYAITAAARNTHITNSGRGSALKKRGCSLIVHLQQTNAQSRGRTQQTPHKGGGGVPRSLMLDLPHHSPTTFEHNPGMDRPLFGAISNKGGMSVTGTPWPMDPNVCGGGGGKISQTIPTTTNTTPIRQLLGAANAQTAHPATSSTAPAHQPRGSVNAETTPAGAPAAAADRKQRPDATCEGKNG